jgi:hypothetical protein
MNKSICERNKRKEGQTKVGIGLEQLGVFTHKRKKIIGKNRKMNSSTESFEK